MAAESAWGQCASRCGFSSKHSCCGAAEIWILQLAASALFELAGQHAPSTLPEEQFNLTQNTFQHHLAVACSEVPVDLLWEALIAGQNQLLVDVNGDTVAPLLALLPRREKKFVLIVFAPVSSQNPQPCRSGELQPLDCLEEWSTSAGVENGWMDIYVWLNWRKYMLEIQCWLINCVWFCQKWSKIR